MKFCSLLLLVIFEFTAEESNIRTFATQLVWSDEFNYSGSPDVTKWDYDLGDGCRISAGGVTTSWNIIQ